MLETLQTGVRRGTSVNSNPAQAAAELRANLDQPGIELAIFFCSPSYDLPALGAALAKEFKGTRLIGCTTAGEITPMGYLDGSLTGISLASTDFCVATRLIENLDQFELASAEDTTNALRTELDQRNVPVDKDNTFGFLLVDGLSRKEEPLVSLLHRNMGSVYLFGGSAADGLKFENSSIYYEGKFHDAAAIFSLIQTSLPFRVFKTQHFEDTDRKMVVTAADAEARIVSEINGRPAVEEYAAVVGVEVNELTPTIFATHPVVVKLGGEIFIRSILQVDENQDLAFACAIDEGIVLTVANRKDMVKNLRDMFDDLRNDLGEIDLVIGCDCAFRMIEMDQTGLREEIGSILAENNVVGFSTYGEQFNAMHINQTLTGVAIGKKRTGDG